MQRWRKGWYKILHRVWYRAPTTLNAMDAYALWAEAYPPYPHNRLMEIEQAAMLRLMPTFNGRVVLDLACGSGRYAALAVQGGAARVIGVDSSMPMLQVGKNAGIHLPLIQSTMDHLPFADRYFDVVICGLATGHLPPLPMQHTLIEAARVLRHGGELIFSDFHPDLFAQGGRRTFTAANGAIYAVEHYPHTLDAYRQASQIAGLTVIGIEEPSAEINGSTVSAVLVLRCRRE